MATTDELMKRYVAVWNEPDAQERERAARELWSEDAELVNRVNRYVGHADIVKAIVISFDAFVTRSGYEFRRSGHFAHHDAVLFEWEMGEPNGGPAVSAGMNFLRLDGDDRIRTDYQFSRS